MLQRDFTVPKVPLPTARLSTGECLLSLQPLGRLQNQTEDETQPEEALCFLSKLFCLMIDTARPLHSWLNTLANYSFLSNELSARVSCEATALTWCFGCMSKPMLQYRVPTHNKQTTNHEGASASRVFTLKMSVFA